MGRTTHSLVISIIGVLTIVACVFGDSPSSEPNININVGRTNEGLSTSSDTLSRESEAISIDGFSTEQLAILRDSTEKREFQTEVNRMMQLIINSLYKNKEIFLRELISNASDALDKIRLLSLTDRDALSDTEELVIRIKANREARTLHIIDTGIGMSMEELSTNLGTIAKSGTLDFITRMNSGDSPQASDLIGQFGVGFYSSFLVSKRVMVISAKKDHPQAIWESDSKSFSLAEDPRGKTLKRGTEIVLFLSEEADDYLQPDTLKSVVKKYSQFINFPIYLWSSRVEKVKAETSDKTEDLKSTEDSEASVEEDKKDEEKTVDKTIWDWVQVNVQKPVWRREASSISEEEYTDLYGALTSDKDKPLGKVHFKAEGDVSFQSVLFIPKRMSGDVFNVNYNYKDKIKLYVHRVFISDAAEELIPKYLGFVVGIVDSDDLPLNVSREMLQQNQLIKVIRKKIVRKVLEMIEKLSEEDFATFWKEYNVHIKLGLIEDHSNRARLAKILRYHSSKDQEKKTSLADYVSRMKKDQKEILYIAGASLSDVKSSPFVERPLKKGFEVIYMVDPLDEYVVQSFTEFQGKPLQNVAKEGLKLSSEEDKTLKEAQNKQFESLLKWLKEDALSGKIERAELSERLSDSPCALVATRYGWSGNMERIMRAQAHHKSDDTSSEFYSTMNKIMEINPRHPLIKELNSRVQADSSDKAANETAAMLFYVATLRSGYRITDPVEFARKIESVMRKNLDVDENEAVEPEPEASEEDVKTEESPATDEDVDEHPNPVTTPDEETVAGEDEIVKSTDEKDEL